MHISHVPAKFRDDDTYEPREARTLWERIKSPFLLATPGAATSAEWKAWKTEAQAKHPILYWLNWDFSIAAKRAKSKYWDSPIDWVSYRTTTRFHVLKIHNLRPGYADSDRQMLHANFQMLEDHVEIRLANRNFSWFEDNGIKRRYNTRCAAAGLAHLDWEISEPDCYHGIPGQTQGDHARIKKELYLWWKYERPARLEAWSCKPIWGGVERNDDEDFDDFMLNRNSGRDKAGSQAGALDEIQAEEDQHMLERLIAVRRGMWT
jgi:hypothetical protein